MPARLGTVVVLPGEPGPHHTCPASPLPVVLWLLLWLSHLPKPTPAIRRSRPRADPEEAPLAVPRTVTQATHACPAASTWAPVSRCSCHGHTEVCEPETGACQVGPTPFSLLPQASVASGGPASAPLSACPRNVSTIQRAPGVGRYQPGYCRAAQRGTPHDCQPCPCHGAPAAASTSRPCTPALPPECPLLCPRFPSSQALLRGSG